ncbi:MAG: acyltransferase [Terriglobales bacterium]
MMPAAQQAAAPRHRPRGWIRSSSRLAAVVQFLLLLCPWRCRRALLRYMLGFVLAPDARIGCALILADQVLLAAGSWIGHGTVVRHLARLELGTEARIGNFNWIVGANHPGSVFYRDLPQRESSLLMEEQSSITHRHILDCTDRVRIGAFTVFAGCRSQILTHSVDLREARQGCSPVSIGHHCFIGTGSILLAGATLSDCCVLAAGSVLRGGSTQTHSLYSGVPAQRICALDPARKFFHRDRGVVI